MCECARVRVVGLCVCVCVRVFVCVCVNQWSESVGVTEWVGMYLNAEAILYYSLYYKNLNRSFLF